MAEMLSDFGHIIGLNGSTQVAVMPTYSTVATGTIVQYVGATDANYTNGYFYKATASGWEVVDVQGEDIDKADKVDSATAGNLAGLNASGNLTDAGWSADKTTSNASGNPISISGLKSNQLAINPIITLEPIQSGNGDPSPSNIRPISGYDKIEVLSTGKNLLPMTVEGIKSANPSATWTGNSTVIDGATFTILTDGDGNVTGIKINKPSTGTGGVTFNLFDGECSLSGNYHFVGDSKLSSGSCAYTYSFDNTADINVFDASGVTQDINDNLNHAHIYIWWSKTFSDAIFQPIICLNAETDHTFEPYHKSTDIRLTLGQTIYGGTLDVEKGILTVDRGIAIFDGSSDESWQYIAGWDNPNAVVCNSPGLFGAVSVEGYSTLASLSCNEATIDTAANIAGTIDTNRWRIGQGNGNEVFADLNVSPSDFNTFLASHPLQVVYHLATPYAIQLTPHEISLLKDYAYVSTNGTNISFSYKNGEMASLGDVESLGKTMNLLGNRVGNTDISNVASSITEAIGNIALPSGILNLSNGISKLNESAVTAGGQAIIDCNNIKTSSIIRTSAESTNMPISDNNSGVLITFSALSNVCVQLYTYFSGTSFIRCCWYNTWSAWLAISAE